MHNYVLASQVTQLSLTLSFWLSLFDVYTKVAETSWKNISIFELLFDWVFSDWWWQMTILSTKKRPTSSAQNCLPTSLNFSKGKTPKRKRKGRKKVLCYTKSACEISDVLCTQSSPWRLFFKTYFFKSFLIPWHLHHFCRKYFS